MIGHDQEPITRSVQLPCSACETGVFASRFIFRSALPASDHTFSFLLDSLISLLDHCKGARKTYKAWIQSKELGH